jgi:hypothetical protein
MSFSCTGCLTAYLLRFIRRGYPVKRKAATFAAVFHSFIPQPASGCHSASPCLAACKVLVKILAVKHIYTVHFSEPDPFIAPGSLHKNIKPVVLRCCLLTGFYQHSFLRLEYPA